MAKEIIPLNQQVPAHTGLQALPLAIESAGTEGIRRFLEFFTVTIRNKNTRQAYGQAVAQFFNWCESRGLRTLDRIEPVAVAAYIEQRKASVPTVKQHLAAIRMLFDWLVTGHIVTHNPATSVRGPKHVVKRGKTPVLTADEARKLLNSIDTSTIIGLRDRCDWVMIYSFARVSAGVSMQVGDFYVEGKRWWLRLHEKGGNRQKSQLITMPTHTLTHI